MELGLRGKVAAITGGSDSIGKATAMRLAQEGALVAICARRADVLQQAADEITASGGSVLAVVADVTNPADGQRFIAETVQRFGRLDILVNNAGTSNAHPFEDVDDEVWMPDLDLKLFGAIRCSRAAHEAAGRRAHHQHHHGRRQAARQRLHAYDHQPCCGSSIDQSALARYG
jgi:3-oxoacyl-[acyl-carrier protein] reductase